MPIKASSARHIAALLDDLRSDRPVARETAVARLTVIGERAVDRLAALASDSSAPPTARAAALRALDGIGHPRGLDVALPAIRAADADVAIAAVAVLRTLLSGPQGIRALDALTSLALDRARAEAVREQALRALGDVDASTLRPVLETLQTDPSANVRALARAAAKPGDDAAAGASPWLDRPDQAVLPDDPDAVRRELLVRAMELPLALLHQTLERLRAREQATTGLARRRWMGVRAAVHVALAARGSRLGVYDLRESLESAVEPLPVEFLSAITDVGDSSCLESIAAAYAAALPAKGGSRATGRSRNRRTGRDTGEGEEWWRRHLADAFQQIAARERLTRRHALIRKIEKRWPDAFEALWLPRPEVRSPKPKA